MSSSGCEPWLPTIISRPTIIDLPFMCLCVLSFVPIATRPSGVLHDLVLLPDGGPRRDAARARARRARPARRARGPSRGGGGFPPELRERRSTTERRGAGLRAGI